ncbi:MAG: M15 family metallopeptidase [Oscillospiraceae bacterium]|jgi:D-alanyl-D-alanine carboxypeptidase|nr:M15 family metallopeptidase [Oscillospiraceae bacterium]
MKKKGTIFALLVILVAGIGLYAAYLNKELPDAPNPTGTSATAVAAAGGTNAAPATAKPTTTAPRRTQTKTEPNAATGSGSYGFNYPGIAPAVAAVGGQNWQLLLVNRAFALPVDYAPSTAVCVPGVYPENREMDARVAPEYKKMYYAALEDDAELIPFSGYRQISTQKNNFDLKITEYRNQGKSEAEAIALAAQTILPPGCSEHEAGLAIDITRKGVWDTRVDFETTVEFKWLQAHAAEYGFILRYPKDKQEITKISYEPWHWRYVGKEAALAMKASGQCLEEYLAAAQ